MNLGFPATNEIFENGIESGSNTFNLYVMDEAKCDLDFQQFAIGPPNGSGSLNIRQHGSGCGTIYDRKPTEYAF